MYPCATLAERLGQVVGWLGHDLMRIAPKNLALAPRRDRTHRQAVLLDQPRAIARTANRFLGVRVEPADTPDRIPPLEMPADPTRKGQMLVEPVELALKLTMDPVRTSIPVQIPVRMEKAGFHPAFRMDQRRYKPHIHDDTHDARGRRVPLAQIRDVEGRPSAASGHGRRETSGEVHIHAFHRLLLRVSLKQKIPRPARSIRARAATLVPSRHQQV